LIISRHPAWYVDPIPRQVNPANLQLNSGQFQSRLNLKTTKALRLDVPPTLLALADEVIE
jgi:putative tryptophan/tyrosine transport system substrate-binding protein